MSDDEIDAAIRKAKAEVMPQAKAILEQMHRPAPTSREVAHEALRRAAATDAVTKYFADHPEAGKAPYFHHREGIARAVIDAIDKQST